MSSTAHSRTTTQAGGAQPIPGADREASPARGGSAGPASAAASVLFSGYLLLLAACQAFPPPTMPSDFSVSFERGPCFGTCPTYLLTVDADGSVLFNGQSFVLAEGQHSATLSPAELARLHQAIVAGDFLHLEDRYEVGATDLPSMTTTVRMDGDLKSVYHYGLGCGTDLDLAPPALCEVEAILEGIAQSNDWVSSE